MAYPFEVKRVQIDALQSQGISLQEFCRIQKIDEIVVNANHFKLGSHPRIVCLLDGIQVTNIHNFLERYFYKVECERLGVNWLQELDLHLTHPIYHRWKRLSDIAISLLGLILTSPMLIIVSLATWIESGGPIFYTQKRVGLRGKLFTTWKFHTMRVHNTKENSKWAQDNDKRIKLVCKILRRTRFDEIPQFWNILKGDMSMIGPRLEWEDIAQL